MVAFLEVTLSPKYARILIGTLTDGEGRFLLSCTDAYLLLSPASVSPPLECYYSIVLDASGDKAAENSLGRLLFQIVNYKCRVEPEPTTSAFNGCRLRLKYSAFDNSFSSSQWLPVML